MTQTPAWQIDIRGEGSTEVEIDIYDRIGASYYDEGVTAKDVRERLQAAKRANLIKLRVNSAGGDVWDAIAIHSLLVDHPARVEADIDALAASAATIVVMAADEIRIASSAMLMIHRPWSVVVGNTDDLHQAIVLLEKLGDRMADLYEARTTLTKAAALELMENETWMDADEAVAKGFADKIREAKARPEAYASLDLSCARAAPAHLVELVACAQSGEGPETQKARQMIAQMDRLRRVGGRRPGESEDRYRARIAAAMRGGEGTPIDRAARRPERDLGDEVAALMLESRGRGKRSGLIDRAADAYQRRTVGRDEDLGDAVVAELERARGRDTRDLVDRAADAYMARRPERDLGDEVVALMQRDRADGGRGRG